MLQVPSFKFQEKGITLVEIIIVVFIIALFSVILVANFPKILRQFALSRATYILAQDIRKAEDLGLSGVVVTNGETPAKPITTVKGYGLYINMAIPTQYLIYADLDNSKTYTPPTVPTECSAEPTNNPTKDCIVNVVDLKRENASLSIESIRKLDGNNIAGSSVSINFVPPDPAINIADNQLPPVNYVGIKIVLRNTDGATRSILVNTSGLIDIQ